VIVAVFDGPMHIEVRGDTDGQPFVSQAYAERAAAQFRHHGGNYSVYVQQVKTLDGGT